MSKVDFNTFEWNPELIDRYNLAGPRYTSYPTAPQFHDGFRSGEFAAALTESNATGAPLSLYFHIPFCAKVCFYCGCNKIATKDTSRCEPYLHRVYQEMDLATQHLDTSRVVNQLHWGGGTPTFLSHQQMHELMQETRKRFALRDDDLGDYSIEIDPREIQADTLPLLRELGFNRMSFGLQDLNLKVQEAVNRVQPREMTEQALQQARDLGFRSLNLDLIYGLPHQTPETFAATLEEVIEMNPDRLSVFNYAHLPERFKPQRRINAEDLPSPEDKLTILEQTIRRLVEAGYVYIGMDHFARPEDSLAVAQREGRLHRNFQGYTTHSDCDLLAMGASSISQVGPTYAQNHHDTEGYEQCISKGEFATLRGMRLTDDDLIRRAAINQLICHFELDGASFGATHNIDFDQYFAKELKQLQQHQQDGLLHIKGNQLLVTPAGRLLIRSICMVFDAYLDQASLGRAFSRII
ncbi:oxygen-independent coproporphyrinogen III oxidase [Marinospirillum alkaliphilum]|uniref:Coproporphyrinogen-III oxidase n=1 Tax=Marinospirillum alkaliphilum DSM 21637 TaxID=1122209 RepID=A0A1K1VFH1_9GAMM|nr:oxygen-independent coproporphyrinogen III oxidase [Marinospirillum alkaliphilum]SFX23890.1 oxygen-independent coproporphyrinogen-3 oxidase [Marinospirillum alkaliphilum DSM 21637]